MDGEKYNKESLQRRTRKLGTINHPSVGASYNNLGITYDQMGDHKQALFHFLQGLDIKKRTKASDKSIVISLNNVANQYGKIGSFEDATELLNEALRILDKTPRMFQNVRALTMLNYGKVLLKQMRYKEAICCLQKSVLLNKTNQPSHICLVESLMHLAEAYFGLENYAAVLRTIEEALPHRQKSYKEMPQNIFVLKCLETQIDTNMKIGNHYQLHESYLDAISEIDRLISVFTNFCNVLKIKELREKANTLKMKVKVWCESKFGSIPCSCIEDNGSVYMETTSNTNSTEQLDLIVNEETSTSFSVNDSQCPIEACSSLNRPECKNEHRPNDMHAAVPSSSRFHATGEKGKAVALDRSSSDCTFKNEGIPLIEKLVADVQNMAFSDNGDDCIPRFDKSV